MPGKTIEQRANEMIAAAQKDRSPARYLTKWVATMAREDVETLAVAYLLAQVKTRQRGVVRTVEKEAVREVTRTAEMQATLDRMSRERQEKHDRVMAEISADIQGAIEKFKDSVIMEWTEELLASKFARGDGTSVTWGEATREDHQHRASMHLSNARAGMEGAARHQAALALLDQTGAVTLNDALVAA
jgi:hypothetical protein